jgi:ABC-type branched-subunit amino acid transport system substrate-binding protein
MSPARRRDRARDLRRIVATVVAAALAATLGPAVDTGAVASGGAGDRAVAAAASSSCGRLGHRTGVTRRVIRIANVSDVTGPAPGLYLSARQGARAYAAYFNAHARICGRKLKVLALDSATDPVADRAGYAQACSRAFAAVGSASVADDGGAATAQGCRLPDLRAQTFTASRYSCSTCFAAQVDQPHAFENAVPDFFLARTHAATQAAALLHLDAGSWVAQASAMLHAETTRGMNFVYTAAIDLAEFDYGPYVQQLKTHGVKLVQFAGPPQQALRLAQAMQAAAYVPDVFLLDPGSYTAQVAGFPAAAGAYVPVNFTPFAEAASSRELRRYKHWLHVVAPGAAPTPAGLFAWSAARLFARQAVALGGRLSRGRLVRALRGVHRWTDKHVHARQNVGARANGNCWRFLRLGNGRWSPVGGTAYLCDGKTAG